MYRILIVEDEDIIRKGLRHIISKMELDIQTILEAENGSQALKVVGNTPVDLIITDIKMPEMDGLVFIEKAKNINPELEFIILSGFSEFDFAVRAIHFGVNEYLLKPVNKTKLKTALTNILTLLNRKNNRKQILSNYTQHLSVLHDDLLFELLTNSASDSKIQAAIQQTGIQLQSDFFVVVAVYLPEYLINLNSTSFEQIFIDFNIILKKETDYHYCYYLLNLKTNQPSFSEELLHKLISIPELVSRNGRLITQMGISSIDSGTHSLPALLKQAQIALDNRLVSLEEDFFSYARLQKITDYKDLHLITHTKKKILTQKPTAFPETFHFFFEKLLVDECPTAEKILFQSKQLEQTFSNFSPETKKSVETMPPLEIILSSSENMTAFIERFTNRMVKLAQHVDTQINEESPIDKAISYIQIHYDQDITLEDISTMVSMSSSYFSTMFKKKTGESFIHYLQTVRIQQSIKLLQNPEMKIFEIAEAVGFHDEKYFFKIFKKITGNTPRKGK